MNFLKFFTVAFFISTSAKAGLVVTPNEINFPDTYKDDVTEPQYITVTWTDDSGNSTPLPLIDFMVSMSGNSKEFQIDNVDCLVDSETGNMYIDSGHTCYLTIFMAPLHHGIKKKKLNFDGSYGMSDSLKNDVSLTIPVTGTSYPINNPNSVYNQ